MSEDSTIGAESGKPLPLLHHADEILTLPGDELVPGRNAFESEALKSITRWAKEYLTRPHPDLGRSGHVCPWVEGSIRNRHFLTTMLYDADSHPERIEETFEDLKSFFLKREPTTGRAAQLKTIVVLFPGLSSERIPQIINGLHQRMKPRFVSEGLMLGEFFSSCEKPGLRNPHFRPLRSDIPLIVIRMMVQTDIAFLADTREFTLAYLRKFQRAGADEVLKFLDNNREMLEPDRVAMLLQCLQEFGSATELRVPERDYFTGLFTMDHLIRRLDQELTSENRRATGVAVLGLDDEQGLIARHGEAVRPFISWEISRRLRSALRAENMLVSYGPNRFGLLVRDVDSSSMGIVADRVRATVADQLFKYAGTDVHATVSVGYSTAMVDRAGITAADVIAEADRAHARASEQGNVATGFSHPDSVRATS